jgi:hypothetical protein
MDFQQTTSQLASAILAGVPVNSIIEIINQHPEQINMSGPDGNYPLHLVMLTTVPDPNYLNVESSIWTDRLPGTSDLDVDPALRTEQDSLILIDLLNGNGEICKIKNEDFFLPIHLALENRLSYEIILRLIDLYPECLTVGGGWRPGLQRSNLTHLPPPKMPLNRLPIFFALDRNAPLNVIELISTRNPQFANTMVGSLDQKEDYGRKEILIAALRIRGMRFEVIKYLLDFTEKGYTDQTRSQVYLSEGSLLHEAARYQSLEVVEYIYEKFPDAIKKTQKYPNISLPLYAAISSNSDDVIKFLIDKYPDAVKISAGAKDLPLHTYVTRKGPSLEIVRLLLEIYPDAARIQNSSGEVPLVKCSDTPNDIKNLVPLEIIALLLEYYPEAHEKRSKYGYKNTPLEEFLRAAAQDNLFDRCIELVKMGADPNKIGDYGLIPSQYGSYYEASASSRLTPEERKEKMDLLKKEVNWTKNSATMMALTGSGIYPTSKTAKETQRKYGSRLDAATSINPTPSVQPGLCGGSGEPSCLDDVISVFRGRTPRAPSTQPGTALSQALSNRDTLEQVLSFLPAEQQSSLINRSTSKKKSAIGGGLSSSSSRKFGGRRSRKNKRKHTRRIHKKNKHSRM